MSAPLPSEPSTTTAVPPESLHPRSLISEVLHLSLIALVVVLPIRMFIAQPFIVSGASMETTFTTGQYLIVDQISYRFEEPERGDVIVFRYPKDPSKFFIKRIIGLPGDTVTVEGRTVTITNTEHPEGLILEEDYVFEMTPGADVTETLGTDEFFVMGDNRDASSDSRMWGVLPRDNIVGRAFVRLYPVQTFGLWPGAHETPSHAVVSSP